MPTKTFASLFSGFGGVDIGAIAAGLQIKKGPHFCLHSLK
jgi:site-specific DNA-cytosine methylase